VHAPGLTPSTTPTQLLMNTQNRLAKIAAFCALPILVALIASPAFSQPPPPPVSPIAPPATAQPPAVVPTPTRNGKPASPPRPGEKREMTMEPLELVTRDGVKLRAFYFPSDKGKEAVPVIICHEWQGQASPYQKLVKQLWDAGCAVIVPEFRGHGGSREFEVNGKKVAFDLARMSKLDVGKIITGDMEAVKKFLRKENNDGRLNLNSLALVGIREGAIIAAHWAVADWNFPSVGAMKQGQDVKAIVLVSPEKILKGVSLDETLQDRFLWQLPFYVVVGRGSEQFGDADRFFKRLETMRKRAGRGATDGLWLEPVQTSLSGPALINEVPGVAEKITLFIKKELVDQAKSFPYVERD